MGRYLAILHGAATEQARQELTAEDSDAFVARWAAWAGELGESLVDPGAPLYRKVLLSADGAAAFEDSKVAYAIVEAATHDHAVEMFASHPHLDLGAGNSIEIIECPAPPT